MWYPPSSDPPFPMEPCSFNEESRWIRTSLSDLLVFGRKQENSFHGGRRNSAKNETNFWKGTATHILNVILSLILIILFVVYRNSSDSILCVFCSIFSQVGIMYDNLVNAIGKFIGDGRTLRRLSKARYILHVVGIPLMAIPITDVAAAHGIVSHMTYSTITAALIGWAACELFHWLTLDINALKIVDLRSSIHHRGNYLAGTLSYTSGKVLEMVLPVIVLIGYELTVGCLLVWSFGINSQKGILLTVSSIITLASCAIPGRPDIQLFGENFHGGMIWAAFTSVG